MGIHARRRQAGTIARAALRAALLAVLVPVLAAPGAALAKNPTINANFFRPSVHPGALLGIETALMARPMEWGVGAFLTWSHRTVRLEDQSGADVYRIVGDLVVADVYGHFAPTKWLDIGLDVPVFLWSAGDTPPAHLPLSPATGASLSDLRLGLKFRVLGGNGDGFGLAFTEDLTFPTATDDDFGGDRYVTSTTLVVGGFSMRGWNVALNAGVRLKAPVEMLGVRTDHQLLLGLGFSAPLICGRLEALGTAEMRTRLTAPFQSAQHDALDLLAGLRGRLGPVVMTLAGGAGVLGGYGTPLGRVTLGVAWAPMPDAGCAGTAAAPEEAKAAPSEAGVPAEAAPLLKAASEALPKAETAKAPAAGAAPSEAAVPAEAAKAPAAKAAEAAPAPVSAAREGDRDGDGVTDGQDACPDVAGTTQDARGRNGCPPDRDGDGVIDALDMCPDVPGTALADPAHLGCPPDRDGDGVLDALDACPDQAGAARPDDPTRTGCPRRRDLPPPRLEQVVEFDRDSFRLRDDALPVLAETARTLVDRPGLLKVEVQGHTDDSFGTDHSDWLSEQRALVVREYLVRQGVDPARLVPKGYGNRRPVADNATEEGRQRNRRVQFRVLEGR